ncbi:MAG: hypothetical protein AB1752_10350 [Candidatus Zixiibacteriota bacterium]
MDSRRGERLGWTIGWLGGFLWVAILAVMLALQSRWAAAVTGCAIVVGAVAVILRASPWRCPRTPYWKLMLPVYALFFGAIGWAVLVAGDLHELGIVNWWSLFLLLPLLLPLWINGRRRWSDAENQS